MASPYDALVEKYSGGAPAAGGDPYDALVAQYSGQKASASAENPRQEKPDGASAYDVPAGVRSAMNIGQAMTFGFGDEIAGKLGLDRDRYRKTVEAFREEYPGSAALGSISGSMLLPLGVGKAAVSAPYLTAGAVGAGTGLLQGAGDAPELKNVPADAAKMAAAGALLGPLIVGGMKPVGSLASVIGSQVATRVPGMADDFANMLARNRIVQAFERDKIPVGDIQSRIRGIGSNEARLADAGGSNVRGTLDINASMPGRTKNELDELVKARIAGRPDRMTPIVEAIGGRNARAADVSKFLSNEKKKAAPLYDQLHATDVPVTGNLKSLLTAAQDLGATATARKIATAEREPFTLTDVQQALSSGKVSMRDADLIKRGIDDLIERETDEITGKMTTLGRSYVGLKRDLVSELDTLTTNPQTGQSLYKSARDAFAGPAAMQSALDKGRLVWADNAEGIANSMASMSKSEQEAFKVGAAESLRQKFGSQQGQSAFMNEWKDRNVREKLQALLGKDFKYADVTKALRGENTLKMLESVGKGSQTASRLAGMEDQAVETAADLVSAGVAAKTGGLLGMFGAARPLTRMGTPEPVRDAIGRILMSRYTPEEMSALTAAQRAYAERRAAAAAGAGTVAGKSMGLLDF